MGAKRRSELVADAEIQAVTLPGELEALRTQIAWVDPAVQLWNRSLLDNLEEESLEDTDYYITPDTLDYLATRGADARLVALLRQAIGDRDGIDIRWSK